MAILTARQRGTPPDEMPGRPRGETGTGERGQVWYTVLALSIAAAAFLVAWALHGNASSTYRIDSHWGAFTGLFIMAHAIERAIEPFSRRLGPDTTKAKNERDRHLACVPAEEGATAAVEYQLAVDRCRRLTGVVAWGTATAIAFLLCAELNITLLQAIRSGSSGAPPFWADLLVTGLVVGAGTKPLHDLVLNIDRGKQARSAGGNRAH